jgi:hypothetical protein
MLSSPTVVYPSLHHRNESLPAMDTPDGTRFAQGNMLIGLLAALRTDPGMLTTGLPGRQLFFGEPDDACTPVG